MEQAWKWLRDGLAVAGLILLAILSFLLVVVLIRPLIVIAAVAVLVAVLLSLFSPRVRDWFESPAGS